MRLHAHKKYIIFSEIGIIELCQSLDFLAKYLPLSCECLGLLIYLFYIKNGPAEPNSLSNLWRVDHFENKQFWLISSSLYKTTLVFFVISRIKKTWFCISKRWYLVIHDILQSAVEFFQRYLCHFHFPKNKWFLSVFYPCISRPPVNLVNESFLLFQTCNCNWIFKLYY